jgi:hypothetical protein
VNEPQEMNSGERASREPITLNLDSIDKVGGRTERPVTGSSEAITVNWDPVVVSKWEFRPPGPETEKYRKLLKRWPLEP